MDARCEMEQDIRVSIIQGKIHVIRGIKVMLDRDLAELYGVETKVLNQAVKRNSLRFPDDFMIQLTPDEYNSIRSQFVTLKAGKGQHSKYLPYAFSEQGVAMLSTVLNSETAIHVNIQIMRVFTSMRQAILSHEKLQTLVEKLASKVEQHDEEIQYIMEAIDRLLKPEEGPAKKIGYMP